jgi:hypothetical protein
LSHVADEAHFSSKGRGAALVASWHLEVLSYQSPVSASVFGRRMDMKSTGDEARTGSDGTRRMGSHQSAPRPAVSALAAGWGTRIDLPSGMPGQDDRVGDSLHGAFVVPSQLAWTSASSWRVSSTTRVLSGLQTLSPWWRRSDSTCRAFEAVTTCSRIPGIVELINLQEVGGQAKPYQVRQFLKIVERYNLQLGDDE